MSDNTDTVKVPPPLPPAGKPPAGSVKTTKAGLLLSLGVLLVALGHALDGNPNTVVDWPAVVEYGGYLMAAVGGLLNGLWARDDTVTSEEAKAAAAAIEAKALGLKG